MRLLETIRESHGRELIRTLARQAGIGEDEADRALAALIPEMAHAMRRGARTRTGAPAVHAGMHDERFARYVDDPSALSGPDAQTDGRKALDEIFASESEARQAAQDAAAQSGVSEDAALHMLPAVAALALGALNKELRDTTPTAPGHFGVNAEDEAGDPLARALASIFGDPDVSIDRKP